MSDKKQPPLFQTLANNDKAGTTDDGKVTQTTKRGVNEARHFVEENKK